MNTIDRLADAFLPYHLEIPITSEQVADFQARVERQRAETEYWERLIAAQNAGCDEAYDR